MPITVLEFTTAWCGPCRILRPTLATLAAEYRDRITVREIDCDREPQLAQQFDVRSVPAVVLVRDGREVGRTLGARPRAFLAGMIDRALAGDAAIACP